VLKTLEVWGPITLGSERGIEERGYGSLPGGFALTSDDTRRSCTNA
jgi:hypothetical protein